MKKIGLDPTGEPELTVFVYDAGAKLIGEYSTVVQTGSAAKTVYTTNDHLGSPRINTDATGQVISRHDYHPFGEEIARAGYGADTIRQQFTGYERDNETDLDFAETRMFSSQLGRFTVPDLFSNDSHLSAPQSWNLYAYVRNNPLRFVDTDGRKLALVINGQTYQVNKVGGSFVIQGNDGKNEQVVFAQTLLNMAGDKADSALSRLISHSGDNQIILGGSVYEGTTGTGRQLFDLESPSIYSTSSVGVDPNNATETAAALAGEVMVVDWLLQNPKHWGKYISGQNTDEVDKRVSDTFIDMRERFGLVNDRIAVPTGDPNASKYGRLQDQMLPAPEPARKETEGTGSGPAVFKSRHEPPRNGPPPPKPPKIRKPEE